MKADAAPAERAYREATDGDQENKERSAECIQIPGASVALLAEVRQSG